LLKVSQASESTPAQSLLTSPSQVFGGPLPIPLALHKGVFLGFDMLHGRSNCVGISVNLESGDFFVGLKGQETANGRIFRKNSRNVELFPEKLTVRVLVDIAPCGNLGNGLESDGSVQPDFAFDLDFVKSLGFEGFWKHQFEMKKADVRVLTEAQTQMPVVADAIWWEYVLDVQSRNVPLTNVLIIDVLSPEGKLMSRFAADF
jgi:hypothetical protein